MNIAEKDASSFRCCGPEGCGDADAAQPQRIEATKTTPVMSRVRRVCVGSACMAWQWIDGDTEFTRTRSTVDSYSAPAPETCPEPPGEGWERRNEVYREGYHGQTWLQTFARPHPARTGFCGLASERPHFEVYTQNRD